MDLSPRKKFWRPHCDRWRGLPSSHE